MLKKNSFKLGLLISAGIHFSLIIIFPLWETAPPEKQKPEIMQVALIEVKPEKAKPEKVTTSPPPPPSPPPEQKAPPKISPVEVAVKTSQNIPVLTPHARSESKTEIPFPTLSFGPVTSPRGESAIYHKKQEKPEKSLQVAPIDITGTKFPPKISSSIHKEAPSLTPSPGTGEEGVSTAKEESVIKFKGLGSRKVIYQPEFTYPEEMEKQGKQGSGVVEVDVAPNGHVIDVRIIYSAGFPQFDQEIIRKARYYKFSPVDEAGIKTYPGEFNFRLEKK